MSVNNSEARLAELTRRTFLSLWSYQNPHYEAGKELCDVLVVFGDDVVLMSDKLIAYGAHPSEEVNWKRWYKKAVAASIRQLVGAKRQILRSPGQIFSDSDASAPFPLRLPPSDRMRLHLVAVANGSRDACLQTLGIPGLHIDTRSQDGQKPLTVGTLATTGDFVHVLCETSLEKLFGSLDTARDFVDYLERKEKALTDGEWLVHGEENLLAAYLESQAGDGAFEVPVAKFPLRDGARLVNEGIWTDYQASRLHTVRAGLRARSTVLDDLIEHVFVEYQRNRLVVGQGESLEYHAQAWKLLASESRVSRQLLATALRDILGETTDTFWSTTTESIETPGLFYVFLTYPQPPDELTDEELESALGSELAKYMLVARAKFPSATRVFGFCLPNADSSRTSRLFRVLDGKHWGDEMQRAADQIGTEEGVMKDIQTITFHSIR
jgi:hypothetical protein